jgi:Tol biopolymer transport system component
VPRRGYRFDGEVHALVKPSENKDVSGWPKKSIQLGALGLGLILLAAAGVGWYVSRSRPTSTETPPQPIPLTSYPGAELSPTFSPDGSQVAFSWNGPQQDNFDIYVKLVGEGDAVRLTTDPAPDGSPAWSPDGRQIAFVREGSVFVISPLGGPERKLADMQARKIAWTPDGKSLAISSESEGRIRVALLSLETRKTRFLTSPPEKEYSFGDLYFAISPDGVNLAFARFPEGGTAELWLAPMAGGTPRRLTETGSVIFGVAWSVNGQEVVYTEGQPWTATIWRRGIDRSFSVKSVRVDGVEDGSLEPAIAGHLHGDTQRLAYERVVLDTNIWAINIEESPSKAVQLIASTRRDADPQFSPDGRRLAFASDRSGSRQIWIADADGSNQTQLTSFTSSNFGFANAPRWSPDGKQIAFMALVEGHRDIYVIPAEGGPHRRLTTEPSLEGRPSWSQNGRWIYFYSTRTGEQEIWKMPVEGGNALQVTTGGGHEAFESPDGKLLYYQFRETGLRSISTSESSPKAGAVFLPGVQQSCWAVSNNGIYFIKFEDSSSNPRRGSDPYLFAEWGSLLSKVSFPVQLYDFVTRKTVQVGMVERPVHRSHPAFSVTQDGRRIAWSQIDHAESDLMMIGNFK